MCLLSITRFITIDYELRLRNYRNFFKISFLPPSFLPSLLPIFLHSVFLSSSLPFFLPYSLLFFLPLFYLFPSFSFLLFLVKTYIRRKRSWFHKWIYTLKVTILVLSDPFDPTYQWYERVSELLLCHICVVVVVPPLLCLSGRWQCTHHFLLYYKNLLSVFWDNESRYLHLVTVEDTNKGVRVRVVPLHFLTFPRGRVCHSTMWFPRDPNPLVLENSSDIRTDLKRGLPL